MGGGGGVTHSGISEGKGGGVKTWKPTVVEYGYSLELPNAHIMYCGFALKFDNLVM